MEDDDNIEVEEQMHVYGNEKKMGHVQTQDKQSLN